VGLMGSCGAGEQREGQKEEQKGPGRGPTVEQWEPVTDTVGLISGVEGGENFGVRRGFKRGFGCF
jgi:hypothetical protein